MAIIFLDNQAGLKASFVMVKDGDLAPTPILTLCILD